MLKGIPVIISPELMQVLMEMGHGDEIVLADGNFPAAACAKRLIRSDGHGIVEMLEAILKFFPMDKSVERPTAVMSILPSEKTPDVWHRYEETIKRHEEHFADFERVERFAFYERAKNAFAIIATSDQAYKGNLILKKGVIRE
jgi:L-fucose mutarotase